jgi:hypothetical protein
VARCSAAPTSRSDKGLYFASLPLVGIHGAGGIVEGCGVQPDVDVPLSTERLRDGKDNELDAAVSEVESI